MMQHPAPALTQALIVAQRKVGERPIGGMSDTKQQRTPERN
jgi:hypothetical protein